ncbi:siderophore-interacting protein [Patulibacter sp. S7RM1-6]
MRQRASSDGATRKKERPFPLLTGRAVVARVDRLSPTFARIVFAGEDLADLPDEEPGEIVTLIWPADGHDDVVLPEEGWRFPADCPAQHARNYTVRDYDRDAGELVVDFVLHGDHGHASRWAGAARPGDVLGFAGPRIHFYAEPAADWTLLVGDETALPSIAATAERLPAGHRTVAFVEVPGPEDRVDVAASCDLDLRWVHREGEPAGRSRRLERAVREAALPDGRAKVWVAGESLAVRGIREHLRDERGLEIGPMQAIGYWKHRDTPDDVH